jgi:succinoglycan biosynthesis transport protein ExoP
VRIITQAAPSVVPASPKTALILGAIAFVALALQVGITLFGELMSGRAVYDRNAVGFMPREDEPAIDEEPVAFEEPDEVVLEAQGEGEADLFDTPEPMLHEVEETIVRDTVYASAAPVAPAPRSAFAGSAALALSNLAADIALGRVRVVMLAGIAEARDAAVVADRLVNEALTKGLSVCRVDAGSARASSAPGITDLCADAASFGDVVHKISAGLAEVPWGQLDTLERRSTKPVTLIEALADIYEVVIVSTGRIGLNSSLPVFAGAGGRLVLVRQEATPSALADAVAADATALGFDSVQTVSALERQPEVA